ncbi:MAG: HDIG domain-containing protein [Anaerolineae bacterium]|nr:HDIG domain-containing protein [Anaerolineae bacterium]
MSQSREGSESLKARRVWALGQVLFWIWITAVAALAMFFSVPGEYDLAAGDVAPQNISAPRDVTFISEILSQQARDDAARRVVALYTPPDSTIAREQYNRARDVLAFLRSVRADTYGTEVQRMAAVWAVEELVDMPEAPVRAILTLPDSSWSRVQLEFLDLLDQVMRQEEIRETDLAVIQRRLPTMVPLDLPQDEAEVVEALVVQFLRPNAFYDEAATNAAKDAAREAVGPAVRQFRSGEVVVREGAVIAKLDAEALGELGLTSSTESQRDRSTAVLFAALLTLGTGLLIHHFDRRVLDGGKQELLISLVLTLFLALAWLMVRSGDLVPYLFPGAAAAMLIATTVGKGPAVAMMLLLGGVSGWISDQSLGFSAMILWGGLFAVLALPRYEQTGPLFRSGLVDGVVQALVVLIFSIDELAVAPFGLGLKLGVCIVGGLISGALTVGGLFVLTPLFDLTTTFRLTELSRPNHPLLQRLLREAPATFNHVMMVTSLAEQAAERIGANALLTRVGAYYHDIGKLARPYFFAENQQGLSNPHDRLDPYASVEVLAGHVRDGLKMAKRHHLPAGVRAFIPEHHGTMRVSFLYRKAVEAAGGEADLVDESQFRYPGPKPQSREALLVMLADSSEAATRARRPSTPEELADLIDSIFDQRMKDGQMDDCPITMPELATVKAVYVDLLRGAFHPRVQYPSTAQAKFAGDPTIVATGAAAAVGSIADEAEQTEEIGRPADDGDQVDVPGNGTDAAPATAVAERPTEPHEPVRASE